MGIMGYISGFPGVPLPGSEPHISLPEWLGLVNPRPPQHTLLGVVKHHGVVDESDATPDVLRGVA